MREVAIIGCGMTKFGYLEGKGLMDLLTEASLNALDDAGTGDKDFDAVYVSNVAGGELSHQRAIASGLVDRLNLFPAAADRVENGPASGGSAVKNAFLAVASGINDLVLVVGGEKMMATPRARMTDAIATIAHPVEYLHGVTLPALAAMFARLYMHRYGVTRKHLAMVTVKNHTNALKNPYAHEHTPISVESILEEATMVSDPLTAYDCCPTSDGAAALVLCPAEKAREFCDTPVRVAGFGQGTDRHAVHEREDPTILNALRVASQRAFKMANLKPKDIDVVELHDAFTILEIAQSEDAGFFAKGQGHKALEEGVTAIDGKLPINPSGGLNARGHALGATGVAQIVEQTRQLRGDAEGIQVSGASRAYCCSFGGFGNNVVVHILERAG